MVFEPLELRRGVAQEPPELRLADTRFCVVLGNGIFNDHGAFPPAFQAPRAGA